MCSFQWQWFQVTRKDNVIVNYNGPAVGVFYEMFFDIEVRAFWKVLQGD